MFLNHPNDGGDGPESMPAMSADAAMHTRLQAIERLLSLLRELPVDDPPADLAQRTLRFVETAHVAKTTQSPTDVDSPAPHPVA